VVLAASLQQTSLTSRQRCEIHHNHSRALIHLIRKDNCDWLQAGAGDDDLVKQDHTYAHVE